jgi:hypothetical protein
MRRSVAPRSLRSNVSFAPEPGAIERPRPMIVAWAAFVLPSVTGAMPAAGASIWMIATSSSTLSPFSRRHPGCIATRTVLCSVPPTSTYSSSFIDRLRTQ